MVAFKLRLGEAYWSQGFFNVPVDFQRFLSGKAGPVDIYLGTAAQPIAGRMSRDANRNGTPRVFGNKPLRDFFQSSFRRDAFVVVEIISETVIRIGPEGVPLPSIDVKPAGAHQPVAESPAPMLWPDFQQG